MGNNLGQSLTESLMSLLLFGIIFLLALPTVAVLYRQQKASDLRIAATYLAQSLIDQLYSQTWSGLSSVDNSSCDSMLGGALPDGNHGVCFEAPVAVNGFPTPFRRYSVVCDNSLALHADSASDQVDYCNAAASATLPAAVPSELECDPTGYAANQKEIKVLVAYRAGDGECKRLRLTHATYAP